MKRHGILVVIGITMLSLVACKGEPSREVAQKQSAKQVFEGAHVSFDWDAQQWDITCSDDQVTKVLTAVNHEGTAQVSVVYFEGESSPDQVYHRLYTRESRGGTITKSTTSNGYEGTVGEANYQFHVKVDENTAYKIQLKMMGLESGGQIGALARIVDTEASDSTEVDQLWKSIAYSVNGEIKGLATTPAALLLTAEQLREYIERVPTKKASSIQNKVVEVPGYQYLKTVTLSGRKGERDILGPLERTEDLMRGGLFYREHGVRFEASLESMTSGDTTQILRSEMNLCKEEYDQYASEYLDYEEGEIQIENGIGFAWSRVKEVQYDGELQQLVTIFYVEDEISANQEYRLAWNMTLEPIYADDVGYQIVAELERAYQVNIQAMLPAKVEKTLSGDRVRFGQEIYIEPVSGDAPIKRAADCQMMGQTQLSSQTNPEQEPMTVYIPMGKNTSVFGTDSKIFHASGTMYGVSLQVDWDSGYLYSNNLKEQIMRSIDRASQSMKEQFRDYKNVQLEEVVVSEDQTAAMGVLKSQKVSVSGEYYPYIRIFVLEKQEQGDWLSLKLVLDASEYIRRTDILLKEIEQLYHLDLSKYKYDVMAGLQEM